MSSKFAKLKAARGTFPEPIACILDEVFSASDDVHEFVRLLAAYELLVKIVSASCHGSILRMQPSDRYFSHLRRHFVEKPPSMGDWVSSYNEKNVKNRLRSDSPKWHIELVNELSLKRDTASGAAISDVWRMCRVAMSNRAFIPEIPKSQKFTFADSIETVINLRNSYAHGALTYRFANRFSALLADALAEIGGALRMSERWNFVIPRRFSPLDSSKAIYIDCELIAKNPSGESLQSPISGPIAWRKLHLVEKSFKSLDDAICLEPFLRFEECHRDFQVLNGVDRRDGIIEYLSYRSGDFDHCLATEEWFVALDPENTSVTSVETDEQGDESASVVDTESSTHEEETDSSDDQERGRGTTVSSALQESELNELMAALERGKHERTRRNCRNRFYNVLEDRNADDVRTCFSELADHIRNKAESVELLSTLGQMQREFRLYEEAVSSFRLALEHQPDDLTSKQALGHSLLRMGDDLRREAMQKYEHSDQADSLIAESGEVLKDSLFSSPESQDQVWHNVRSLSMLVDVHCKLQQYDVARQFCQQGLEWDENNERLQQQKDWLVQRAN